MPSEQSTNGLDQTEAAKSKSAEIDSKTPLEYALSIWTDTRGDSITREDAALVAEELKEESLRIPASFPNEWHEGWQAACETIAMALRFKDFHF